MGQVTLVESQIGDGHKLVDALAQNGIKVTAAFWAKTTDDEQWYFYIASPIVDAEGLSKAYRRVYAVIRQLQNQPFWIDPLEVKLLGPQSRMAESAEKIRGNYPGITRSGGTQLGGVGIEGAYVYPLPASKP